jgi:hypothetical protein
LALRRRGAIAAAVLLAAPAGCGDEPERRAAPKTQRAPSSTPYKPPGKVRVAFVRSGSACIQRRAAGKVQVVLSFRNTGDQPSEEFGLFVSLRGADGTRGRRHLIGVEVEAGGRPRTWTVKVPWPRASELVGCRARASTDGPADRWTRIPVRR